MPANKNALIRYKTIDNGLRNRYADPDYSITEMPLSIEDCKLIKKAIVLLENKKDKNNEDTIQVLNKVQDRLKSILNFV